MSALLEPPAALGADAAPAPPPKVADLYKGLDYFEDSNSDRMAFAGRDGDIYEIVARIVTQRALVIYGRSGLGKTSLLLAGVFPRLRERGFHPVYVRAFGSPAANLAEAIQHLCPPLPSGQPRSLIDLITCASSDGTLVLVFDQFEEFFIQFRDQYQQLPKQAAGREELARGRAALEKQRDEFVELISRLIADESRDLRVVFSLREDYLAALNDFQRQLPDLFRDAYRLLPLTAFGCREAIIRPLLKANVPYDERLVTRLINELAEFDFDSARLQIICLLLFRLARVENDASPRLKEDYLNQLIKQRGAGLGWVFRLYIDEAVKTLPPERDLLGRIVLDALITPERTKRAMSLEELRDLNVGAGVEGATDLEAILKVLCEQNIVRAPTAESGGRYELIHECLIPEILKWLEKDGNFATFRHAREVITNGCRGDLWRERPEFLLFEDTLTKLVSPYKERLRLEATPLEFVVRSSIYHGSKDTGYWVARFDNAKAFDILLAALGESDPQFRRNAASVVGQIKDIDGRLFERCWDLALDPDEKEEVRRAAGKSLGVFASDQQLRRINSQLGWFKTPKPVKDLLADWSHETRKRAGVGWWWRWRASRISKKRIWKQHEDEIQSSKSLGSIVGLWSGFLWSLICLPFFGLMFGWFANPWLSTSEKLHVDQSDLYAVGIFAAIGLGLISYLGRRAAGAGARAQALRGRFSGSAAVRLMQIPIYTALLIALCMLGFFDDSTHDHLSRTWRIILVICMLAFPWMARFFLAAAVQVTCDCIAGIRSNTRRLFWCFLTNLEFFLVLPALVIEPLLRSALHYFDPVSSNEIPSDLCNCYAIAIASGSLFHWVTSISMTQGGRHVALPLPTGPRARKTVFGGALFSLVWAWCFFGPDSLLARLPILNDSQSFTAKLFPWPKTSHFDIESTNRLFKIVLPDQTDLTSSNDRGSSETTFETKSELGKQGYFMFFPSGQGRLAIQSFRSYPKTQLLFPIPISRYANSNLSASNFQIVECDLHWSNAAQAWTGQISGQLPKDQTNSVIAIDIGLAGKTLFDQNGTLTVSNFQNGTMRFQNLLTTNVFNNFDSTTRIDTAPGLLSIAAVNATNPPWGVGWFDVGAGGKWSVAISLTAENASPAENSAPDVATGVKALSALQSVSQTASEEVHKLHAFSATSASGASRRNTLRSISVLVGVALGDATADVVLEADRLRTLGNTNAAINWYAIAVQRSPGNPRYQYFLARELLLEGRYSEAIEHSQAATRLDPHNSTNWVYLARSAQGVQQWDQAVSAWEQVLKLDPTYFTGADRTLYDEAKRHVASKQ